MHHQSSKPTTVEATVFDSAPRVSIVAILALLALVPAALAGTPLCAAMLGLSLLTDLRPRRGPKKALVRCLPGALSISGVGKIRARDLVGATTSRHGNGVSLMLAHERRNRRPIILDLPDESALEPICKSLGIGHHGFGYVDVALRAPIGTWFHHSAAAACLPFALMLAIGTVSDQVIAAPVLMLGVLVWIITRLAASSGPPTLRLTSAGAFVPTPVGTTFVPFSSMERVASDARALSIAVATPDGELVQKARMLPARWTRFGPSREELEHAIEQLDAAKERAHGRFVLKSGTELAAVLERAKGEPLRDWLARLDTIGVGGPGYRTTAAVTTESLWQMLEDPDASADVRAAAARILRRLDPERLRVRVPEVFATIRDEPTRFRIAASLDEDALAEAEQREAAMTAKDHE